MHLFRAKRVLFNYGSSEADFKPQISSLSLMSNDPSDGAGDG